MFREEMNLLIEILKDANIVLKRQPSVEEVEAFAEETGNGPELKPMRLCFAVKMSHAWNRSTLPCSTYSGLIPPESTRIHFFQSESNVGWHVSQFWNLFRFESGLIPVSFQFFSPELPEYSYMDPNRNSTGLFRYSGS